MCISSPTSGFRGETYYNVPRGLVAVMTIAVALLGVGAGLCEPVAQLSKVHRLKAFQKGQIIHI